MAEVSFSPRTAPGGTGYCFNISRVQVTLAKAKQKKPKNTVSLKT